MNGFAAAQEVLQCHDDSESDVEASPRDGLPRPAHGQDRHGPRAPGRRPLLQLSSRLGALQHDFVEAFFSEPSAFFLTGGGALAGYHLGHRVTDDLDLFSPPAEWMSARIPCSMREPPMGSSKLGSRSTADDVLAGMSLQGRTMLVTGANSGIGFETARALAAANARVLIACRSVAKGTESAAKIVAQHPHAKVTPVELDLASFGSVRRAAGDLPVEKLDALICNAGLYANQFHTTEDGIESTVGVCHFGHFLLTQLLRPRLRAADRARVVMVASESHRYPSTLKLERFPLEATNYKPLVSYGQAKLCNVLFANELTRRFAADGITASSLHPGSFIGTDIFRSTRAGKALSALISPFTKSIPQGAATTVYCAVAPELEGVGGRYFADCQEKPASAGARDPDIAARLWTLSEERVSR